MAIKKERKEELVAEYKELIGRSEAIILTAYKGMTVKEVEALRGKVAEANGRYNVTKNTLLGIALKESDRDVPEELLVGQLATGFALGEAAALAKVLTEQAKASEKLTIVGGMLGKRILTAAEIDELAKLPSLDQLRAQILGLIGAPAQGIVSAVTNGVRQVINVVDAYARTSETPVEAEAAG